MKQTLLAVLIFMSLASAGFALPSFLNNSGGAYFGGQVGINVSNPSAYFQVNSSSANGAFLVQNTTGAVGLLVNGSSGNVGIGTTNPTYKLMISGSETGGYPLFGIHDTTASSDMFNVDNFGRVGMYTDASVGDLLQLVGTSGGMKANYLDALTFGGASVFMINNNGLVGINTSSPASLLSVYANTTSNNSMVLLNQSGSGGAYANFTTPSIAWTAGASPDGSFQLVPNTTYSFNVGKTSVGSQTDSGDNGFIIATKFYVYNAINITSMSVYVANPIDSSPKNKYSLAIYNGSSSAPDKLIANGSMTATLSGNAWNTMTVSAYLTPGYYWLTYMSNSSDGSHNNMNYDYYSLDGYSVYATNAFGSWPASFGSSTPMSLQYSIYASGSDSLRSGINSTGTALFKNGIYLNGTYGSNAISSSGPLYLDNVTGQPALTVDTNGNVGVGTTGPTSALSVNGDLAIVNGGNIYWNIGSNAGNLIYSGDLAMRLETQGIIRLNIDKYGNIGINNTAPNATLHIVSNNANGALLIQNSTGSAKLFVNGSSGNVGIKTTSPNNTLVVNGDFNVTGNSYLNGLSISGIAMNNGNLNITGNLTVNQNTNLSNILFTNSTNVGINTTNPNATLHVVSDNSNGAFIVQNSAGTYGLYVDNAGEVGISIAAQPGYQLYVPGSGVIGAATVGSLYSIGSVIAGGSLQSTSTSNTTLLYISPAYTNKNAADPVVSFIKTHTINNGGTEAGSVLQLHRSINSLLSPTTISGPLVNFTEDACSAYSGGSCISTSDVLQVMQGTSTNTGAALDVSTASTSAGGLALRVNHDGTFTDSHAFVVDNTGRVGINTTSPTNALTVIGDINVTGNSYLNGLTVSGVAMSNGNLNVSGNLTVNQNTNLSNILFTNTTSVGIGTNSPTNALTVIGDINATGSVYVNGSDVAERISAEGLIEPGDVVVIDATKNETVMKSATAYDPRVAGVVSTQPGSLLGSGRQGVSLALAGRVPIKVTDEGGPILPGDLLTTSSTPGYAMRCELDKCRGAIVAKALQSFAQGKGEIIALISLG